MLKTKPIRFNRIIALLLSLIMLFGVLPFSASAEEDYGIAICGTMLTPSNYEEFLENYCLGQIAYDPSTNTLTFSGFMRSMVDTPVVSYYGKDTVNVVLKGGNHVSGIFFESDKGSIAFSAESTGSLGFGKSKTGQTGIRCAYMDVDGGSIMMTNFTNGIKADFIDVTGGNLVILSDDYHASTAEHGISANEMRVSGGEVYVCGYSDGLEIGDRLTVSGGDVTVEDATRAVSADDVGIYGTGVLNVEGDAVGIEASVVSVTGSAELHAKTVQGETKPALLTHSYFEYDKNTHFIKKPKNAKIAAHPEGETVFEGNGDVATEVSIVPWIACFVSRNGGAEERVAWSFENKKVNLFQCPVGETVTVRLVSYDEYGTFDTTVNGMPPHAQAYVTETASGKSEKSFTFSPEDRIESEVPTSSFGHPSGVPNQFSFYHNIFFRQLGSSRQGGVLVFETLKGDLTFDEITTQTADSNKMHTIPLPMNDSRGNPVVPSKDGAPKAEDLEVELTGDRIFLTYIVQSLTEHNALYVLPGAIGTATVTVSFKGNMSYNPAQITFSVVCQCNNCSNVTDDSALNHHPATDSTCTMEGNDEYWECSQCGKLFADADGKTQITDLQTVLTPAKGHSFTETVGDEYLKLAADCVNPAVYYKSCEHCGISTKELYDFRAAAANFVPGSAETVTIDGVEFYILAVDDGKALLLTKDVVASGKAFDDDSPVWEGSDIQQWLNGEWLDGMPLLNSLAERTTIYTAAAYNDQSNTVASDDRVFLLSEADIWGKQHSIDVTNKALFTYNGEKLTAPGGSWKASDNAGNPMYWWLRSPNYNDTGVLTITDWGLVGKTYQYDTENDSLAVRPAMWVRFADPAPEWQKTIAGITPGSADTVTIDGFEFHVLAKDEAKGEALLLTKHVLFNKTDLMFGATPRWADSMLREFMNGIMPETSGGSRFFFPYHAPTLAQYAQETEIYTSAGYNSTELVMTRDRMFLLSEADLFGTQNDHPEAGSNVFTYNGAPLPAPGGSWIATDLNGTPRYWWLRSPRLNKYSVAQVLDSGNLNSINSDVEDYTGIRGVRPALWIQYKEPVPEPATFTYGDALGHLWGKANYSWSIDPVSGDRTCTAQHACTREGCMQGEFESVTATREETIAPTCTKQGQYTYTATFTKAGFETQTTTSPISPLGGDHEWQVEGWTWDYPDLGRKIAYGDYAAYPEVTLKLKCQKCGDSVSVTVNKPELQLLAEGDVCTGGKRSFIATVQYEGVEYSDKNTFETINAEGHMFGNPTYDWVQNLSAPDIYVCIAARVCTRDGCAHTEEEEVTVLGIKTLDPACGKAGQYTYTAEFKNPAFKTQTKQVPIDPLEHNWVEKVEDKYLKSAADCTNSAVYYKSCERCDIAHDSETFENGDALGHLFGKPAYSWETLRGSENRTCTAKRECERKGCDHFEEEKATVSVAKTTDPTCTEKGQYTYTAAFKNTAFETQKSYSDIAELGHEWVEKAEDQYLKTAADCTNAAVYHKSCSRCGEKHASETFESGNALGHDYDEWYVVTPATDRRKGLDRHDCKRDGCNHFETRDTDTVEYKTELEDTGNGKTTVEPADPQSGDEVKITVTPEEDKRVKEITVTDKDGNKIDVTDKGNGEYEFTMPDGDVTIEVEYEPKPTVTVDENEGGKTVIGPKHPDTGDRVDFTVTPEEDKRVKEITVTDKDGNKIDVTDKGNGGYVFTMPDSDVSIKVVYEPKPSPEIPPTGDNSKLSLWLMLMCISGIGVIATSLKRKKRKDNS